MDFDLDKILPQGVYGRITFVAGGGLGNVYRAELESTGQQVALKVIRLLDDNSVKRVQREVKLLGKLDQHPHISHFREAHLSLDSPTAVLVSEWVDGISLSQLVASRGQLLPENVIAAMARQLCLALNHLHHNALVHRDLKPSNIIASLSGDLKLVDFGIVKSVSEELEEDTITQELSIVGTLRYLPPEVLQHRRANEKSDVYSLGMTIVFLVTGELPVAGDSLVSTVSSILSGDFPLALPETFSASWMPLLRRVLSTDPADRPLPRDIYRDLEVIAPPSAHGDSALIAECLSGQDTRAEVTPPPPPRPLPEPPPPTRSSALSGMVQSLSSQIAHFESVVADVTAVLSQRFLSRDPQRDFDHDSLEEQIKKTFETIGQRLQSAWKIGLVMTIMLFALFIVMVAAAVALSVFHQVSGWSIVFGSTGVLSLLGVLIWRPMDKMFFAAILIQQLELIQLNYYKALAGTREERKEAFRETVQQLDSLLARVVSSSRPSS